MLFAIQICIQLLIYVTTLTHNSAHNAVQNKHWVCKNVCKWQLGLTNETLKVQVFGGLKSRNLAFDLAKFYFFLYATFPGINFRINKSAYLLSAWHSSFSRQTFKSKIHQQVLVLSVDSPSRVSYRKSASQYLNCRVVNLFNLSQKIKAFFH
jgi:hypothetical protein